MSIKILVVEDSAFMRKVIIGLIDEIDGLEVVGIARDGIYAKEAIENYKPDIITLDIEMPKQNGLDTLKEIRKEYTIPVIILSSISKEDLTVDALQMGAEDFIEKPVNIIESKEIFKSELETKIKAVVENHYTNKPKVKKTYNLAKGEIKGSIDAVVIAASTGGPKALSYIVSRLPKDTKKPVFIVQHMPKTFTTSFAKRLNQNSELEVVEARNEMSIVGGTVYLAPGDYHMFVENGKIILTNELPKILGVRPAADYLFISASKEYGKKLLGVVLTGMGRDATNGVERIAKSGGYNIAQDESSCVIFGMSESAISSGYVNEVLSLDNISKKINSLLR